MFLDFEGSDSTIKPWILLEGLSRVVAGLDPQMGEVD